MKKMIAVTLLLLTDLASASVFPIRPYLVTEAMNRKDVIATCTINNPDASYIEFNINAMGDMIATLNPEYSDMGLGKYLLYSGLDVQTPNGSVLIKAVIMTVTGEIEVDLNLKAGTENKVLLADQEAVCQTN